MSNNAGDPRRDREGAGNDPNRDREGAGEKDESGKMKDEPNRNRAEAPSPVDKLKGQVLKAQVIEALRTVFDPEIPVNIYDLGLIYEVNVDADSRVNVRMTLTSPMCPVAESLPPEAEAKVRSVDGVTDAKVEVVWDPPWTPDKMTEAAKLQLNM